MHEESKKNVDEYLKRTLTLKKRIQIFLWKIKRRIIPKYKPIYTVTTLSKIEMTDLGIADTGSTRTPCFYHTLKDAKFTVENNACDIWEYCYQYAVIEEVDVGCYPYCGKRWFYKWEKDKNEKYYGGRYVSIDTPEELKNVVNFAIG